MVALPSSWLLRETACSSYTAQTGVIALPRRRDVRCGASLNPPKRLDEQTRSPVSPSQRIASPRRNVSSRSVSVGTAERLRAEMKQLRAEMKHLRAETKQLPVQKIRTRDRGIVPGDEPIVQPVACDPAAANTRCEFTYA